MIIPSQSPISPSTSLEDHGGRPFPAPANPQMLVIVKVSLINRSSGSPRQTNCTLCGASACMTSGGTCCDPTTGIWCSQGYQCANAYQAATVPGTSPNDGYAAIPGPDDGYTAVSISAASAEKNGLGSASANNQQITPRQGDPSQCKLVQQPVAPAKPSQAASPSQTRPNAAVISAQGASTHAPASIQSTTSGVSSASSTPTATNTPSPSPLSTPQIVAVTVSGFAALGFFVWILWYFFQRARKRIHSESQLDPDRDELLPKELSLEISPVDSHPRSVSRATIMTETRSLSSPVTPY